MSRSNPRRWREMTPDEHRQVLAWLSLDHSARERDRRDGEAHVIALARVHIERQQLRQHQGNKQGGER